MFNGFGTTLYGKRDFGSDGSFLTTKWAVFFWVPLLPLKSLRVQCAGPGGASILPGWSRKYQVLAECGPHTRQVVAIYSFVLSFILGAWLLDSLHAETLVTYGAFAIWACVPWLLRWRAKRAGQPPSVQWTTGWIARMAGKRN